MKILDTVLPPAFLIEPERAEDERGFFARIFDHELLAGRLEAERFVQHSVSFNERRGTLRGIHYQAAPHEEAKLVRCTAGAVWDVVVDLRPQSPHYLRSAGFELTAANARTLYVPKGFGHGFLTLTDAAELFYQISESYHPELARGIRWNDPALNIAWPFPPAIVWQRDASFPDLPV
ncbi:MAG TPA: dTDP-4-dehydrorhamnose 3,5-epimerase [Thermoanaerobaculia bacterium]|nr:dTDP-4-dehydrorhamnose 3,5-epimerase [Thermoanaerobaculia bacterium]